MDNLDLKPLLRTTDIAEIIELFKNLPQIQVVERARVETEQLLKHFDQNRKNSGAIGNNEPVICLEEPTMLLIQEILDASRSNRESDNQLKETVQNLEQCYDILRAIENFYTRTL